MSVSSQITRIQQDRNTIRNKMVNLGLAESTADLDDLALAVDGIANRGAVSAEVQIGASYTIPAGYHNGSGTVLGVQGSEDFKLQAKSATPTKQSQSITPDSGYYGLSSVSVAPIPEAYQDVSAVDAVAGDVLANKKIVNSAGAIVAGTMPNNGKVSAILDTETPSYSIPAGYHNGQGAVSIDLESKSATPSESTQLITPTEGKVLSEVEIAPIPDNYGNVDNADATVANILSGKTAVIQDENGDAVLATGSMPNQGAISVVLDADSPSHSFGAGYYSGGTASIVLEDKEATPTESQQIIEPSEGKVLSSVVVNRIPVKYGDTTVDDVSAGDVLVGKKALTNVEGVATQIVGTMPNQGSKNKTLTVGETSFAIPRGYHDGTGIVNISTEEKSATPSEEAQNITPSSGKVLSKVAIAPIPEKYGDTTIDNVEASDILVGKKALTNVEGVATQIVGTMVNQGAFNRTLDASTPSVSIPVGYHNGEGAVSIELETKSATPSESAQVITPTAGKVLGQVNVAKIPAKYGDATGMTVVASHLLEGDTAIGWDSVNNKAVEIEGTLGAVAPVSEELLAGESYTIPAGIHDGTGTVSAKSLASQTGVDLGKTAIDATHVVSGYQGWVNGEKVSGTMANNGAISGTIDGLTTTSFAVPAGYTSGGSVSLTNDIEEALAAI